MLQSKTILGALTSSAVLLLVAAPSATPGAPASAAGAVQDALKEKDHEKLGKLFAEYLEARASEEGIGEAQEAIQEALEKLGKKRGDNELQAALALSADLGRAYYFATDYSQSARKIKAGSINDGEIAVTYPSAAEITYAVWAPTKYKPKDGPYPLILAIPELGSSGPIKASEHIVEHWIDGSLRDGCIVAALDMPEKIEDWSKLATEDEQPGGVTRAMFVFRELRETYAIDFDRVFLAGRGPGVAAALEIAARYPQIFAGVLGRAGDASNIDVTNFRNVPTFFAGAGAGASDFQERAKTAGFENVTIQPDGTEADLWAWIQDHPRNGNPLHITLNPRLGTRAYWLDVPPSESTEDTIIEAKIDRESNTVTVTAEHALYVTLYFNDQLLDLSKPVKVVINGLSSDYEIVRNLAHALDLTYRGTNDPGRFYVAYRRFDVPE